MKRPILILAIALSLALGSFAGTSSANGSKSAVIYCTPLFSKLVVRAVSVTNGPSISLGTPCADVISELISYYWELEEVVTVEANTVVYTLVKGDET